MLGIRDPEAYVAQISGYMEALSAVGSLRWRRASGEHAGVVHFALAHFYVIVRGHLV